MAVQSNKYGSYFGFLNRKRKQYIAYSYHKNRFKLLYLYKYSGSKIVARQGRNPQTKENLHLHLELPTESWCHVIFEKIKSAEPEQESDDMNEEVGKQDDMVDKKNENRFSVRVSKLDTA